MKKFIHLANRPELSFGMRTENKNGKRHYVTPEGELYPSITTILSEFSKASIQEWRKRVRKREDVKTSAESIPRKESSRDFEHLLETTHPRRIRLISPYLRLMCPSKKSDALSVEPN